MAFEVFGIFVYRPRKAGKGTRNDAIGVISGTPLDVAFIVFRNRSDLRVLVGCYYTAAAAVVVVVIVVLFIHSL